MEAILTESHIKWLRNPEWKNEFGEIEGGNPEYQRLFMGVINFPEGFLLQGHQEDIWFSPGAYRCKLYHFDPQLTEYYRDRQVVHGIEISKFEDPGKLAWSYEDRPEDWDRGWFAIPIPDEEESKQKPQKKRLFR